VISHVLLPLLAALVPEIPAGYPKNNNRSATWQSEKDATAEPIAMRRKVARTGLRLPDTDCDRMMAKTVLKLLAQWHSKSHLSIPQEHAQDPDHG
jgi:hypothetical protein